jgi:hypothetical protein
MMEGGGDDGRRGEGKESSGREGWGEEDDDDDEDGTPSSPSSGGSARSTAGGASSTPKPGRRRRTPRIVVLDYHRHSGGTSDGGGIVRFSVIPLPSEYVVGRHRNRTIFQMESMPATECPREYCATMSPSWHAPNALEYVDENTKLCEPMHQWQYMAYPNCNAFHEVEMKKLRVINTGGSRIAFEMNVVVAPQSEGERSREMKFVYKTIKYRKDVTHGKIDEQRKDSLIMERATKSKFIPNIHGYCSLAVMMDFMPEGECACVCVFVRIWSNVGKGGE